MGASIVKEVSKQTMDRVGDGTTTATILAHNIYLQGCKAITAGFHPIKIMEGINIATQ